jgi:ubiquinone/menaquinone biosynthesis C-methylase UbiE
MKILIKQICPPVVFNFFKKKKEKMLVSSNPVTTVQEKPVKQDLDLYWDPEYVMVLDDWGKDNAWNEIQMILANCKGKILDIACGSCVTIKILEKFPNLDLYGFDISDLLIKKGIEKGISQSKLNVCDATNTNYANNEFDFSYSIGSLEHFTEEGIDKFIHETSRYTITGSFHMIPVSRNGKDIGWIKTLQSYFNNSENWWYKKFRKYYSKVYIIPSKWEDDISYGRWFMCFK